MNVALFCREDSSYKKRPNWEVYDIKRDATSYNGKEPAVCHPPCRSWGNLSHMAHNTREGEKELVYWSLDKIRNVGGILEHPKNSKIFKELPNGMLVDEYGGFTVDVDQYDFGHVAHKNTKLYIVGISRDQLPELPIKDTSIHLCEKGKRRSICGNVAGTTRCTQYQREYTPEKLIDWFESVLNKIRRDKYI
jgi:hypothetical protein